LPAFADASLPVEEQELSLRGVATGHFENMDANNDFWRVAANQYATTASVGNAFIRHDAVQQTANFNMIERNDGPISFPVGKVGVGTLTPDAGPARFLRDRVLRPNARV
jgi:hypothetical protein